MGALARVCVSGPQNRKRSQEGINPPSELSRSLSRHNHGAAGGDPIIELPCILYQTPRTLIRERFFTGGVAGFCGSLQLSESLCSVPRRTWPTPVIIQEPKSNSFRSSAVRREHVQVCAANQNFNAEPPTSNSERCPSCWINVNHVSAGFMGEGRFERTHLPP